MSLFFSCFLIVFSLSGCNFQPVYRGEQGDSFAHKRMITLVVTGTSEEAELVYKLKTELAFSLNSFEKTLKRPLKIVVKVSYNLGDIGYDKTGAPLRSQGRLVATLQLYSNNVSVPFYTTQLDAVSSYTTLYSDEFSKVSAQSALVERLVRNLAQSITQEVISAQEVD